MDTDKRVAHPIKFVYCIGLQHLRHHMFCRAKNQMVPIDGATRLSVSIVMIFPLRMLDIHNNVSEVTVCEFSPNSLLDGVTDEVLHHPGSNFMIDWWGTILKRKITA